MRWAALLALMALGACSSEAGRSAAPAQITDRTTTTERLAPDEAFLADLHDQVDFDNPEWGDRAIGLAEQVCGSLSAGRTVLTDDAPNDSPQTDASISDSLVDMTLSVAYDSAGEDVDATAAVLVLGAEHFCPEWLAVVEADATARGLTPR